MEFYSFVPAFFPSSFGGSSQSIRVKIKLRGQSRNGGRRRKTPFILAHFLLNRPPERPHTTQTFFVSPAGSRRGQGEASNSFHLRALATFKATRQREGTGERKNELSTQYQSMISSFSKCKKDAMNGKQFSHISLDAFFAAETR